MPNEGFYSSKDWHKARTKTIATWRASGRPCHWCGAPLPWGERHGVIVDHIQNRKAFPHLALELNNLACVCHPCNTKKAIWSENAKSEEIGADGLPASWR